MSWWKDCVVCEAKFEATRSDAQVCSDACRKRLSRTKSRVKSRRSPEMANDPRPPEMSGMTGSEAPQEREPGSRIVRKEPSAESPGTVRGKYGELEGRDPRKMTRDELGRMGHEPMSPMEAIRAHCLDCCGGSSDEVLKCMALRCPSWPFRTGKNPWREVTDAQREQGRQLAAARQSAGVGPGEGEPADAAAA